MDKAVYFFVVLVILLSYQFAETKTTKKQLSKQRRSAGLKKISRQLDDFKRHVNYNLLEMSGQIMTLFDRVDNLTENKKMQGTVFTEKDQGFDKIGAPHEDSLTPKDLLKTINELSEEFNKKYAVLSEAFAYEKQMNRELRSQLAVVQDNISHIYPDIVTNVTSYVEDLVELTIEKKKETLITETPVTTKIVPTNTITDSRRVSCDTVPSSGIYDVSAGFETPVTVFCEKDPDDVGWIVFLRRKDGTENFDRPWADYKNGFGKLDGEFWAGNDLLHKLTKSKPATLRIDMEDFDGNKAYAEYDQFQIGSEKEKYKLSVSGYSGTAGDSLINATIAQHVHHGANFSTYDSDNDQYHNNCAEEFHGGWWFNSCFESHLTGRYSKTGTIVWWEGVIWYDWKGDRTGLKFAEMKIRVY